ncbi:MAG TPA: lytic transglycosylase domain-containing protein [Capsulimonadaceae bacterium]
MNRSTTNSIACLVAAALASASASFAAPKSAIPAMAVIRNVSVVQTEPVAPPVVDETPGKVYIDARTALKAPLRSFVSGDTIPATLSDVAGLDIEVSGRVVGRASLPDDSLMLIVDCKGVSLNLSSPSNDAAYWLQPGTTIRAIVSVPDAVELTNSRSMLPVVASAPEFAVVEIERAAAAKADALAAAKVAQAKAATPSRGTETRRTAPTTSRSASYQMRDLPAGQPIAPLSEKLLAVYPVYRAFIAGQNSRLSANQIDTITTSVLYYSDLEKLDPRLVIAMILAESNFNPWSTSHTGAMGLSQLMPGTAAGLGVNDAYDPVQNIGAAVHILSSHVRKYGGAAANGVVPLNTLFLTMAAYNAGSGAVRKYGGVPPYRETQNYVRKVAALYRKMCSE